MQENTKKTLKTGGAVSLGMGGAALFGFAQGAGIDHILADKILDSLKTGDIKSVAAYVAIFLLIWLQVKGLRNEVKEVRLALTNPEGPIAISFAKGEARMNTIEEKHSHDQRITEQQFMDHEHRITILEQHTQGG